jgi:ribonuclease HI
MPAPSIVDILRHIAREEPLSSTVRVFRGLTREHLGQLLEDAAGRLGDGPLSSPEPPSEPPAAAVPGDADADPEEPLPASEGRARKAPKRTR